MYKNQTSSIVKPPFRNCSRQRHAIPTNLQSIDERRASLVIEELYSVKLRRRGARTSHSFYNNYEEDADEPIVSKWTIVRQRLPDILALSQTYKPTSVRAQLALLVALMNRQTSNAYAQSRQIYFPAENTTISQIIPNNVIIDISGRSRLIRMKSIPPDQVIYVDVDNLSFSIATRQLILAISRGNTHTWRYCPPAISEMLIDISKAKVYDDRRQYERAQFKMRIGQILFLFGFMLILIMVLVLIIGTTNAISIFYSFNDTDTHPNGRSHNLTSKLKIHESMMNRADHDDN